MAALRGVAAPAVGTAVVLRGTAALAAGTTVVLRGAAPSGSASSNRNSDAITGSRNTYMLS